MVFSLKLEGGHNLLCSAEELAQFPILPRASLTEDYKMRFLSLSQLVALPVTAPMAIDDLRNSQLAQFLSGSSSLGCHVQPLRQNLQGMYLKQLLPSCTIRVDFKDGQNDSIKDANVTITTGQKPKDNIQSSSEGTNPSSELQVDPSSVVLDCQLCGASVGLWAFSTIPRPLEYIRFVGLTEVIDKSMAAHGHDEACAQEGSSDNQICTGSRGGVVNTGSSASTSSGFTIAGGPPPASLNYGATISLPIVGQNLRARLSMKTGNNDYLDVQRASQVEDQALVQQSETVRTEETFVTIETNAISDKPLEVPESVPEGSNLNLTVTVEGFNLAVAGDISSSTPEDITSPRNTGASQSPIPMIFSTRVCFNKPTEFDPIKQHRHFCPWTVASGKSAPGWLQTLSALEENKELSNVHSSRLIEVDDPVESVRTLFTSPVNKRAKIC
ncbi:hypothetical protein AAHA92_25920 [Salvia divinorum]|uniref:Uncharacterized protein n=1 Tax=Salvia divinorum TaxID=28513 RepID=A0ABD1GFE4_SALDI